MNKKDLAMAVLVGTLFEMSEQGILNGVLEIARLEEIRALTGISHVAFYAAFEQIQSDAVVGRVDIGGSEGGLRLTTQGYDYAASLLDPLSTKLSHDDEAQIRRFVDAAVETARGATVQLAGLAMELNTAPPLEIHSAHHEQRVSEPAILPSPGIPKPTEHYPFPELRMPIRVKVLSAQDAESARSYVDGIRKQLVGLPSDNEVIPLVMKSLEYIEFVVDRGEVDPGTLYMVTSFVRERLSKFAKVLGYAAVEQAAKELADWLLGQM